MGTDTRGHGYHHIRVHKVTVAKYPFIISGYPFSYLPRAHDGFYPHIPAGTDFFSTPSLVCKEGPRVLLPSHENGRTL